jgi:riboflavin synthase
MFTGIIEETGVLQSVKKGENSSVLTIRAKKVLENTKIGDSIAANGVCLTVTSMNGSSYQVDVMAETLRRSNLGSLEPGDSLNLERALRVGDRLGGHIVSGHIDGTGTVSRFQKEDNATWVTIIADQKILHYIVEKGSIAIDGVSLTVARLADHSFSVSIIPHTGEETILLKKKIGDTVNLECDIIGKYVERLLCHDEKGQEKKSGITLEFLQEHGF